MPKSPKSSRTKSARREGKRVNAESEEDAGDAPPPNDLFEPLGIAAEFPPPLANIHPDRSRGWLRRIWPLLAAHRGLLAVGLPAGVLALVAAVGVPAVARWAIDAAGDGRSDALLGLALGLAALALGRALFGGLYRYCLFKLAFRVDSELRALLHRHLTRLSFSFYDRTSSGDVISRANSDIRSIQILLAFAPLGIMSFLTFFLAFALMLTIHVPLTFVALATLPLLGVLGTRFRNLVLPLSWIAQARMAEVATIVDENLGGVRVVKSFAAERAQIAKLARASRRLQWAAVRSVEVRAHYNPLLEALPRIAMVLVFLYGGWLAIRGDVSVGTLFAFNAYVVMLQVPFRMFGFLVMQTQRAAAAAARVYQVLDTEPGISEAPEHLTPEHIRGELEFENVSFGYADASGQASRKILHGFSLRVEPGEAVALVGPTGCGKSTVARLAARFYDIGAGEIRLDGQDISRFGLACLRHHVGILFDEAFLFSVSLGDNIAYARPTATLAEIIAAAEAAQIHEFIDELPDRYDSMVGERGYTLSGGQRQRVAIARALLANPGFLILDDATSAMDSEVESAVFAGIRAERSRSMLIISHRLSTIAQADRVVFTEGGRVVATGTHTELLATEPRYVEVLAKGGKRVSPSAAPPGAAPAHRDVVISTQQGDPGAMGSEPQPAAPPTPPPPASES